MIDIAAIKARADKATSGPWAKNPFTAHVDAFEQGCPLPVCALLWPTDLRTEDQSIADGEFIAHARTDIPALIAALEASESARVKAEQERDALKDCEESAYQRGVSNERKRAEKAEFAARRALESKP